MVKRWSKTALVVAGSVVCMVAAGSASAKPDELAGYTATQATTLEIYGLGGRDDVAQGRLDIANKVMRDLGVTVNNPVSGFNNQAFLARLAARDIPDLVHMGRGDIGTYAARNALVPLGNCLNAEKIDRKAYRQAALAEVTYKGQLYGLPEFTNQITIIVNNDALAKAGVNTADIQTTNWKRLKQANKKLLKVENGRLTRIGFDPKIPEFFPLWVKWFGKDLISKDGLKAQLNSREAVAALAYTVGLINDHGGWNKFKAFRDTWDFFGRNNQVAADQVGAWPMESFYYQVLADGNKVNFTAKYFTNRKGGPLTMLSGNAWAIPRGSKNPGLACKYIKALQSVDSWRTVAKSRFDLRKRQGRAFTGLYTANTQADVKIYEDIYQPIGNKDFDDAVALLVRAPRYAFAVPLSPASTEFKLAWTDAINRVLEGRQTPRQALDQAQREAQAAIDKAK
ncbi:MAG: multiple sugar transport system substrate-binding protein [Gaiellaceae bacterium]|nr:multiple sugar transport system substrate-binding protein [Gaiellaceae bacterium]